VIGSNREAVERAEAAILAVPTGAVDELLGEIGDALDGKIVIDVTNRMNPQDPPSTIDGTSNAERIRTAVPSARVVKAFNTAFAVRQADPVVEGTPIDGFVAGDDERAKREVMDLMEAIGFRPIDAGSLGMGRALEAMGTLIISLNMANKWSWQNGWKLVGPLG
jgi:8-hydroxy-5-deazaflavin:NADPH oxidoreductase